ncbi:hypothetical protein PE066_12810 [Ramlibacter tataouinensis]|uniref:hypothetical protein n=1 Tax=Ramlibacter tataouinensis TaxID=94132 RepID=UPI0022F3A55D|nr:hypothetical protein [Ramlibacter tataouinensis]WBY00353.1 hypothetical protein PE066_12810 [Ramlibacter tataouinensis]
MTSIPATARLLAITLAAAGFTALNVAATPALAAGEAHDHGHASAADKPLPAGKRWATDAALRQGMTEIRHALEPQLGAIHDNKLAPEQYQAIAAKAEQQVAYIVANCKLPPDADAALHLIIGQIGEANEAMAGKSKARPRDGAVKLLNALNEYGRTFDHPGWKKLRA